MAKEVNNQTMLCFACNNQAISYASRGRWCRQYHTKRVAGEAVGPVHQVQGGVWVATPSSGGQSGCSHDLSSAGWGYKRSVFIGVIKYAKLQSYINTQT